MFDVHQPAISIQQLKSLRTLPRRERPDDYKRFLYQTINSLSQMDDIVKWSMKHEVIDRYRLSIIQKSRSFVQADYQSMKHFVESQV